MNKKIMFCGTQCTGKSSLAECFSNEILINTNGIRKISKKHNIEHSENSNEEAQTKFCNYYKKFVKENESFISDRSLIDVFAYTTWLYKHFKISEEYWKKQKKQLKKFVDENSDIIYCYFPIEFPVEDDGIRSIDEDYRKEIDEIIKDILQAYKIDYFEISGNLEDRKNIIYTIL